jgi:hypothetical protein
LTLVHLVGNPLFLEWTVPPRATSYNVYRGQLGILRMAGALRTSDMTTLHCYSNTDADTDGLPDATDTATPPAGVGFTYLVTAINQTGEGPLGPPGADPVRINDAQCLVP